MNKKEVFEWIKQQLKEKKSNISEQSELAQGYFFLELLHKFHPRMVDLKQGYANKEANNFMILQNYKQLSRAFVALGWKKIEPERYVRKNETEYMALACFLHHHLTVNRVGDKQPELILQSKVSKNPQHLKITSVDKLLYLQRRKGHLLKILREISETLQEKTHLEIAEFDKIHFTKQRLNIIIKSAAI